jgi:DNA-binding transcriptional LysR family regulator
VEIAVTNGRTPRIDDTLAELGFARRIAFRTPFPLSAILATSRSEMIYTTPCRLGVLLAPRAKVRVVNAPKELANFTYGMAWHRRLRDDAAQIWLRDRIRDVSSTI